MAQNQGYYQGQGQPVQQQQYSPVFQQQPQNIYQQLGKPQPQPHLQGHPTYVQQPQQPPPPIQAQGFQFAQQQYAQVPPTQIQVPYALSQTPYTSPQTPYQPSQTPYNLAPTFASSQTPYPLSQTPYVQTQPPYTQSQTPMQYGMQQQAQSTYQQQQQQQHSQQLQQPHQQRPPQIQIQGAHIPTSSYHTPSGTPLNTSGSWKPTSSKPPPISPSASLAQQAQAAQAAAPAAAPPQTPGRRPLPQPAPGVNSQSPALPTTANTHRRAPTLPNLETSSPSANANGGYSPIASRSAGTSSPTRSRPLPTPTSATPMNKRATIDLGKLPHGASAMVPSLGPISGLGPLFPDNSSSQMSSSSNAADWAAVKQEQKRTPSPTKSGLPIPSSVVDRNTAETVGLSRTSSYAINNNPNPVPMKRRASPPRFHSQSNSESSSPSKENASTTLWNTRSVGASTSTAMTVRSSNAKAISNSSSAGPTATSSTNDASSSAAVATTPKKFTPMWKRTIPEMPAPAWGYAAGMVSEPHPKPKPVQAVAAPAPAPVVTASPTKGISKLFRKKKSDPPASAPTTAPTTAPAPTKAAQYQQYHQLVNPVQPVQRFSAYQIQQMQPVQQYGHSRAPANYAARSAAQQQSEEDETGEVDEEEEEEEEEEETEEDEDQEDEESDDRYARPAARNGRQYNQGQTGQHQRAASRPRYAEYEEDQDTTPRKKKILRPKVDPYNTYTDTSPSGGKGKWIAEKARELEPSPKMKLRPKLRSRAEDEREHSTTKKRLVREVPLAGDGNGRRYIQHERSRSAFEERDVIRHKREPSEIDRVRRPGSAFIAGERRAQRMYDDDDDDDVRLAYDDDEEEEEESETEWRRVPKNGTATRERDWDRRGVPQHRKQSSSPQYGIRNMPSAMNKRSQSSSAVTRYTDEDEDVEYRTTPRRSATSQQGGKYRDFEPERQYRNSVAGLPQPPAMMREAINDGPDKRMRGATKMKSAPLKYDDYDEEEHFTRQRRAQEDDAPLLQKFSHMKMNANGTPNNSHASVAGSSAWPVDLPRLPRTPGSATTPGTIIDDGSAYFDVKPRSDPIPPPNYRSRPASNQIHTPSRANLNLDDPPPRATVVRTPSPGPGGGYILRRELPQHQGSSQGQPQNHITAQEQLARRRSLYSAPTAPIHQELAAPRQQRPQSQVYDTPNNRQVQSSFGQGPAQPHQPQQSFPNQLGRPPFNNNRMQQTPAPPPPVGIESPHPVGGREKMADIPKMEEDSNDGSDTEHRMIPKLNFRSPQKSSAQMIQTDAPRPPSIPMINVDSAPGPGNNVDPPMIHVDSVGSPRQQYFDANQAPKIQVFEVPGVSVSGPDFSDHHAGPSISISGPEDHRAHHNQAGQRRTPSQAQMGQIVGGQPRSGGLVCGGCHGPIIGRIVSAMGQRYHPACFKCTVCNELLEHVSSYEHEGRPYCHLDYHENFAPRCYSCKTAIVEEQFISLDDPALGKRAYHTQHFFCAECGDPFLSPSGTLPTNSKGELALSGDGEFEGFTVYKGHPYCESCHVRLRLPKCKKCKRSIRDSDEAVEALGGKWCWGCFICASCNKPFEDPSFFQRGDQPYCEHCFSVMLRNEI